MNARTAVRSRCRFLKSHAFAALRPEEIGVQFTDGDMMDPEASVSAIVFHHPDAKYFAV